MPVGGVQESHTVDPRARGDAPNAVHSFQGKQGVTRPDSSGSAGTILPTTRCVVKGYRPCRGFAAHVTGSGRAEVLHEGVN